MAHVKARCRRLVFPSSAMCTGSRTPPSSGKHDVRGRAEDSPACACTIFWQRRNGAAHFLVDSSRSAHSKFYLFFPCHGMRALLERLRWDNRAIASLPLDPVTDNYVRTVPRACFSLVSPTPLKGPALVAHSQVGQSGWLSVTRALHETVSNRASDAAERDGERRTCGASGAL